MVCLWSPLIWPLDESPLRLGEHSLLSKLSHCSTRWSLLLLARGSWGLLQQSLRASVQPHLPRFFIWCCIDWWFSIWLAFIHFPREHLSEYESQICWGQWTLLEQILAACMLQWWRVCPSMWAQKSHSSMWWFAAINPSCFYLCRRTHLCFLRWLCMARTVAVCLGINWALEHWIMNWFSSQIGSFLHKEFGSILQWTMPCLFCQLAKDLRSTSAFLISWNQAL